VVTSNADAQGGSIIAKGPEPLRTEGLSPPPTVISTRPSRKVHGPPTATRSKGPAPRAREARRALARGGLAPRCQAGPPLKRSRTLPSVRNSADTGGRGEKARPAMKRRAAQAARAAHARRRGQRLRLPNSKSQEAISTPVHGRGSTVAHGKAAARTQVLSKSHKPAPTILAAAGTAAGHHASAAHSPKPPASNGPDNGTRTRLTSGPTSEARPNTAIHNGHSAAATATLIRSSATTARNDPGHDAGVARSAPLPAQMIAAQAPMLMTALGDRADAGSVTSMMAAAKVSAAEAVVSRPRARPASAAASIIQARTQGGSAPAIMV
jgi:hypothetical protein